MKYTDDEFAEMIQKMTEEMKKAYEADDITKAHDLENKMSFLIELRLSKKI